MKKSSKIPETATLDQALEPSSGRRDPIPSGPRRIFTVLDGVRILYVQDAIYSDVRVGSIAHVASFWQFRYSEWKKAYQIVLVPTNMVMTAIADRVEARENHEEEDQFWTVIADKDDNVSIKYPSSDFYFTAHELIPGEDAYILLTGPTGRKNQTFRIGADSA
ncbi:hypothetical protein [Pseudomonas gingeri]|uniref:hypothetical protein n=1 Tax=Pseudomonas gingeri TaxID=117681 RepID=UPI0015A00D1A|nr:hypothetical protein [Pseudomonas gingeri]NWA11729.1 hypothetical protein [Pseudomonas gingeri]